MTNETWNILIKAIITIISVLITSVVIPFIKAKVDSEKLDKIKSYTRIAVESAEKLFTVDEWAQKKQYAIDYVSDKCNEFGIDLSADDISILIESLVYEVKKGV